jgi:hypothetical protein
MPRKRGNEEVKKAPQGKELEEVKELKQVE